MTAARGGDELVEVLERWADAGGVWRVVHRGQDAATVALLTCAGGEEVDRVTGDQPAWLAYLADRDASDEEAG